MPPKARGKRRPAGNVPADAKSTAASLAAAGRRSSVAAGSKSMPLKPGQRQQPVSASTSTASSSARSFGTNSSLGTGRLAGVNDPFVALTGGCVLQRDSSSNVAATGRLDEQTRVDYSTHPFQTPGGPQGVSASCVVHAMFEDQTRLFRIIDGTRLLFFNDSKDDFVVKVRFDDPLKFSPHGSARWFAEMIPNVDHSVANFLEKSFKVSGVGVGGGSGGNNNNNNNNNDEDSLQGGEGSLSHSSHGSGIISPVGSVAIRSPSMLKFKSGDASGGEPDNNEDNNNLIVSRYVMDIIAPGETNLFGSGQAIGHGYIVSFGHRPHARIDRTLEPLSCEHIFDRDEFSHAQNVDHKVSKSAKVFPMFANGLRLFRVHDGGTLFFYNDTGTASSSSMSSSFSESMSSSMSTSMNNNSNRPGNRGSQFLIKIDVDAAVAAAGGSALGFDVIHSIKLLGSATREDVAASAPATDAHADAAASSLTATTTTTTTTTRYLITDVISPGAIQPILCSEVPLSAFSISVHELNVSSGIAVPSNFVFKRSGGWDRSVVTSKFVSVFSTLSGKLYTIFDSDRLLLYNDSEEENLDVTVEFPGTSHVTPFGSAIRKKARRGISGTANKATTSIADTVYAGKTQSFCKGEVSNHTITVVSKPVKPAGDDGDNNGNNEASTTSSACPKSASSSLKHNNGNEAKFTPEQIAAGAGSTRRATTLLIDPVTFDFTGPGPMHLTDSARVFSMFEDASRLFRVVIPRPGAVSGPVMLLFYNDTESHDFVVRVVLPKSARVTPAGTAAVDIAASNATNTTVLLDVIPPLATKCVAENVPLNGYKVSFAQRIAVAGAAGAAQSLLSGGAGGGGGGGTTKRTTASAGGAAGAGSKSGGAVASQQFVSDNSGKRGVAQRAVVRPRYSLNGPYGIKPDHVVFECFEHGDGMLFRVVNFSGLSDAEPQRWWFYNDTVDAEMHVSVKFYRAKKLKPLGSATVVHSSDAKEDVDLVSDVILPGETAPFVVAEEIQHFTCNFSAKSVSFASRKRMKEAAAPLIAEDRDRFKELLHTATLSSASGRNQRHGGGGSSSNNNQRPAITQDEAIELCVSEMCGFVDMKFPPHDLSIFRPTRDADDPGFVAWMRPAVAAAADTTSTHNRTTDSSSLSSSVVFKGQKSAVFGPAVVGKEDGRKKKNSSSSNNNNNKSNNNLDDDYDDDYDGDDDKNTAANKQIVAGDSVNDMNLVAPMYVRDSAVLNSWLGCAISALAAYPEFVRDIFTCAAPKDSGRRRLEQGLGVHRASMLRNEWFVVDVVDDFLPCVGRSLCGIRHSTHPTSELWPMLLEKLFAKHADLPVGSYAAILSGDPLLALSAATGFPSSRLDREFKEASDASGSRSSAAAASAFLFTCFRDAARAGNICLISTNNSAALSDAQFAVEQHKLRESGLELDRSYHIMDVQHFPQHADLRLLKVRNNWLDEQHPGWQGAWAQSDAAWQRMPDVAAACGWVAPSQQQQHNNNKLSIGATRSGCASNESGSSEQQTVGKNTEQQEFWIEWRDLLRFCHTGGICYANKRWSNYRVRTSFSATDGTCPLALRVTCKQAASAIFCIAQPGLSAQATEARFGRPYLSVSVALLAPYNDYLSNFLAEKDAPDSSKTKQQQQQQQKYAIRAASSRVISAPTFASSHEHIKHYSGRYVGFKYDFLSTRAEGSDSHNHTPFYVVPHCNVIMEGEGADGDTALQFSFCCYTEDDASLEVQFVKLENVHSWFGGLEQEEVHNDDDDNDDDFDGHDEEEEQAEASGAVEDGAGEAVVVVDGGAAPVQRAKKSEGDKPKSSSTARPSAAPVPPAAVPKREIAFPIVATPMDEDYQFKILGQAPKIRHGWQFESS